MSIRRMMVGTVIVLSLAGCGGGSETVMPDVVGARLDVALSDIERAGIDDEVDVVGGGVFGIVDESNWQVCEQDPMSGEAPDKAPRVVVERSCDDAAAESDPPKTPTETAEPEVTEAPEEAEAAGETLTIENNEELAALLSSGDDDAASQAFAREYAGQTIEFDGNIGAMAPHGDYETRFDILVGAGDFSETSQLGPAFQFRDVNIVSDLGLTGPDIPDFLGVGDNLRFTAEVGEFEARTSLFLLRPIQTRAR